MITDFRALCAELIQLDDEKPSEYAGAVTYETWRQQWNAALDRARAALAQPAPPAAGEVGELVRWLRSRAGIPASPDFPAVAAMLTRAADLLEQRHPEPVPVSERLPGPEDCDENGYCWRWNTIAGVWSRQHFARHWYEFESHWLPATGLPLPAGEGEE